MKYMIYAISVLLITTSCHATPESETVVNKGGDWVNSMVEKSADFGTDSLTLNDALQQLEYDCLKKLSYSLEGENISVMVDMDIVLPEYKMPIVLLEENNIEYEQIEQLFRLLGLQDEKLYHLEFTQMAKTKKQIQRFIELQLEKIIKLNEDGADTTGAKEYLDKLYKDLENAPENYGEAAEQLSLGNENMSKPFIISEQNYNKQDYALVVGESNSFYPMIRINFMQEDRQIINYLRQGKVGVPSSDSIDYIDENEFSLEKGKKIIAPFVEVLAKDLTLIDIGVMGDIENNEDPRPYGYVFIYKRILNGVASNYVLLPSDGWRGAAVANRIDVAFNEELSYSTPPVEEELIISITEDGVYYLRNTSPRKVKEVLSCEASLLPFEQIKDRFNKYILMHGFSDIHKIALEIKKAKLGMMDIRVADKGKQYVSIPVWDFYGDYKINTSTNNEFVETNEPFQVLLTINAIDGSIIDRTKGY